MSQAIDKDEVPADLAAAYPQVGPEPSSEAPGEGLEGMHALLDAEGPLDAARGSSTRIRWVLAVGLLVALAALVLATTGRADIDVYPRARMALDLSLLLGPLALALVATLRPLSRPALSGARRLQPFALGVLGVGLLVGLPVAHTLHPASIAGAGATFWKQAGACFGFGLGFSVLATVGIGMLSRNAARRWLPGALGIWAGGLIGLVSLYFHCPITQLDHLWTGHATVILPVLAVVWALRNRLDG